MSALCDSESACALATRVEQIAWISGCGTQRAAGPTIHRTLRFRVRVRTRGVDANFTTLRSIVRVPGNWIQSERSHVARRSLCPPPRPSPTLRRRGGGGRAGHGRRFRPPRRGRRRDRGAHPAAAAPAAAALHAVLLAPQTELGVDIRRRGGCAVVTQGSAVELASRPLSRHARAGGGDAGVAREAGTPPPSALSAVRRPSCAELRRLLPPRLGWLNKAQRKTQLNADRN